MAGTSTSSGLNNLLADTQQVQTTLPSWMDTAQQNVANQASSALNSAPAFSQTAGQGAVDTLQGANNPFANANANLSTIASGAANPWLTDPNTGAVTPNTNTAMGGLFQAQTDQLNQLLPSMTSGTEAGAIGSGNFGSLRGQTAVDTAKANALSALQAQQMQSALQNQQTGVSAATGQGNVGAQGINAGLTTGAVQMNAPFQGATNYANLVNSINAPTTVSQQNQMSPLSMIGSLANSGGAGNTLLNSLGLSGSGLSSLGGSLLNSLGLNNENTQTTNFSNVNIPSGSVLNSDGTYTGPNGENYDSSGKAIVPSVVGSTQPSVDYGTLTTPSVDPSVIGTPLDPNSYGGS